MLWIVCLVRVFDEGVSLQHDLPGLSFCVHARSADVIGAVFVYGGVERDWFIVVSFSVTPLITAFVS